MSKHTNLTGYGTAEEYLEWESQQEFKSELIDNRVWVMLGASVQHSRVNMSLMRALNPICVFRLCKAIS